MFRILTGLAAAALAAGTAMAADQHAPGADRHATGADRHALMVPDGMRWGAAPPNLPRGAELARLSGNPAQPGVFVIRLRFPDGYRVPPHWHSHDEHITVVSGNFRMGMGDRADAATATLLPAGSYALMPARTHHYGQCGGGCIVQIQGSGPFDFNYVHATDDPQAQAAR